MMSLIATGSSQWGARPPRSSRVRECDRRGTAALDRFGLDHDDPDVSGAFDVSPEHVTGVRHERRLVTLHRRPHELRPGVTIGPCGAQHLVFARVVAALQRHRRTEGRFISPATVKKLTSAS